MEAKSANLRMYQASVKITAWVTFDVEADSITTAIDKFKSVGDGTMGEIWVDVSEYKYAGKLRLPRLLGNIK